MLIYDFKQLGSWNILFENDDIINGLTSEVFSNSLDELFDDKPVLVILST